MGVIVARVVLPESSGSVSVEGSAREVVNRGNPQRVPFENHAALAVFGIGLPADLGFFCGRNGEAEALRPIGASHAASGHADNASGEDDQERRDEGHAGRAANPEG